MEEKNLILELIRNIQAMSYFKSPFCFILFQKLQKAYGKCTKADENCDLNS